jgi:hypothetical protein
MPTSEPLSAVPSAGHPHTRPLASFVDWTREVLAPHGFVPGNALALLGVCRDELMLATSSAVSSVWGPAFDVSSLAGMVFLGRSGMSAAAHHAPGVDGRRRYVVIVLPHIGVTEDGSVGMVLRDGQDHVSTACGALVGLHAQLASGTVPDGVDHDDLELSLLRADVRAALGDASVPDLPGLTDVARRCATDECVRLAEGLVHDADADVAVIWGVVVHHHDEDRVWVTEAWVTLRSDGVRIPLGIDV